MGKVLGFTGTRHGMSPEQEAEFRRRLVGVGALHHGLCVGSDEKANNIAKYEFGVWTVGHPPINNKLRAKYCKVDELREPQDYLSRDEAIVDETDELLATPHSPHQTLGSGTWYTIRYAIQCDKIVVIVNPDGSVVVK